MSGRSIVGGGAFGDPSAGPLLVLGHFGRTPNSMTSCPKDPPKRFGEFQGWVGCLERGSKRYSTGSTDLRIHPLFEGDEFDTLM